MKRIKSACICQTIHFLFNNTADNEFVRRQILGEVQAYKDNLEKNNTKYRIIDEAVQPDGSVILKIIKQYGTSPVGDYLE